MLGHACRRSRTSFTPLFSSLSRRICACLDSPLSLPRASLSSYPHRTSCMHLHSYSMPSPSPVPAILTPPIVRDEATTPHTRERPPAFGLASAPPQFTRAPLHSALPSFSPLTSHRPGPPVHPCPCLAVTLAPFHLLSPLPPHPECGVEGSGGSGSLDGRVR